MHPKLRLSRLRQGFGFRGLGQLNVYPAVPIPRIRLDTSIKPLLQAVRLTKPAVLELGQHAHALKLIRNTSRIVGCMGLARIRSLRQEKRAAPGSLGFVSTVFWGSPRNQPNFMAAAVSLVPTIPGTGHSSETYADERLFTVCRCYVRFHWIEGNVRHETAEFSDTRINVRNDTPPSR